MKSVVKKLLVLAEKFEKKIDSSQGTTTGEYGGKGPFTLPDSHKAAMQVTKGGTTCSNCRFVDADKHECKSPHYILWNGDDPKLPDLPLDEICSDWWESK